MCCSVHVVLLALYVGPHVTPDSTHHTARHPQTNTHTQYPEHTHTTRTQRNSCSQSASRVTVRNVCDETVKYKFEC